jgi:gliding motility-associated-like protein
VSAAGFFSVTVTDSYGCSGTASTTVVSLPKPTAMFNTIPSLVAGPHDTISFKDSSTIASSISSWYWTFGNGDTSHHQNPVYQYSAPGVYNVCLIVSYASGCSDSACVDYTIIEMPIVAPNVFTPNGDGKNDTFWFKNLDIYGDAHLEVFNRWGNKVFESFQYDNNWTAFDLSDGVYYYVLTVQGYSTQLHGWVRIIKDK